MNDQLLALVNRFPGATNHNIKDAAENEAVQKLVEELLAAGAETAVGLVGLLAEPGSSTPEDAKARFLLHAAVVQVGAAGKERERKMLAATLAGILGEARPKDTLAYVARELLWIASAETAPAVGKLLADEVLYEDAARTLLNIGGEPAAAEFRAALPKAQGKARLTCLQNLGVLRDAKSAAALKSAAADSEEDVRVAALWSLANIGEPTAVDLAIKAASSEGYERTRQTKNCLLLAERLAAAGKKDEARRLYAHLQATRTDAGEAYIGEAANRGLAKLAG